MPSSPQSEHDGPRAVLFDLDGVLVDSSHWHQKALERFGEEVGIPVTPEFHKATFGMRSQETLQALFPRPLDAKTLERAVARKEALFRKLARGRLRPLPGAVRLVRALRTSGWRLAVASSTVRDNILMVLNELGLADAFDAIVAGEDVSVGKPAPDVFLLAAQRLEVPPERCIVVEDAVHGVQAARRAGMRVIAVATSQPPDRLTQADCVVSSLEALTPDDFDRLLSEAAPS